MSDLLTIARRILNKPQSEEKQDKQEMPPETPPLFAFLAFLRLRGSPGNGFKPANG